VIAIAKAPAPTLIGLPGVLVSVQAPGGGDEGRAGRDGCYRVSLSIDATNKVPVIMVAAHW
jgi:hypothetical protein